MTDSPNHDFINRMDSLINCVKKIPVLLDTGEYTEEEAGNEIIHATIQAARALLTLSLLEDDTVSPTYAKAHVCLALAAKYFHECGSLPAAFLTMDMSATILSHDETKE